MTVLGQIQISLVDPEQSRVLNVVLTADPETPMVEVLQVLHSTYPGEFWVGEEPLTANGRLADSPLRDGVEVSIGQPATQRTPAGIQLCVVSGPMAGSTFALRRGRTIIGRHLKEAGLAERHFAVVIGEKTLAIEPVEDNSVTARGLKVTERTTIEQREGFKAGNAVFEVRNSSKADADTRVDEQGRLLFNRPSRIRPAEPEHSFSYPSKPSKPPRARLPWVTILAPMAFAIVTVLIFKNVAFLAFGLLSPIIGLGNYYTQRKNSRLNAAEDQAEYEQKLADVNKRIARALRMQARAARFTYPDAIEMHDIATLRRKRIWERRNGDSDYLSFRIGSALVPGDISIRSGVEETEPHNLHEHPVIVDIKNLGVVGIAGALPRARGLARWLLVQLATLHSPNDVRLVILGDDGTTSDWAWARWLPHVRGEDTVDSPFVSIACDRYGREERIKWLLRQMSARKSAIENDEPIGQDIVVLMDGLRSLRDTAGVARILRDGPKLKIFTIGLDSEVSRLAEEGNAALVLRGTTASLGVLRAKGNDDIENIVIEQITSAMAEQVARGVSPLVEAGRSETDRELPDSISLVELLNLQLGNPRNVLERWKATGGRTTAAPLGATPGGTFVLDLKHDGPHGLVAGTTGSGKSEFLQTLVTSLALANRPDALNFLLVDYKGASAFANCSELPHTVGMVTNLDGRLTQRALTALEAELHRRERELNALGAPDVDSAWRSDPLGASEKRLSRLIIVIDEFAELVQELPDFVPGLIRVARVGRSLGIHLILATQRPAGVVSAEMRANTGLRIALRVEDRQESTEVIEDGDAAYISRRHPGRGYARLGGGSGLVAFQTARVAGRRKGLAAGLPTPTITPISDRHLSNPLPVQRFDQHVEEETTELKAIVDDIKYAAEMIDYPQPHSPWQPALQDRFVIDANVIESAIFAIEDRPKDQTQPLRSFDPETDGHLLIAGSARSGRTTALRTLAASLAATHSPEDLHIFGFDFGNGGLLPLASLPHTGAIVQRTQRGRTDRLLNRIIDEIARRQQVLARMGVGDIGEQRSTAIGKERLPYAVVLIDRWEGFLAEYPIDSGTELPGLIIRILREGPGVGIRVVITGDRSAVIDRMSAQIETRIVLRLNDRDDYTLVGIPRNDIPKDMPAGRGINLDGMTDVQFALLDPDPSAAAQNAAVYRIAERAASAFGTFENQPLKVDELPESITLASVRSMAATSTGSPLGLIIGAGGDSVSAVHIDLESDGPYFLIGGAARTGKSTALVALVAEALLNGSRVVSIAPRRSPLQDLAEHPNLVKLSNRQDNGMKLVDVMNEAGPVLVVVDDSSLIAGSELDDVIRQAVRLGRPLTGVVLAGDVNDMKTEIRGSLADARRTRIGLILSPQNTTDGDLVGVRLSRNLVGKANPGRGVLCINGETVLIQVPIT